jgi:tetratricopeptide (TPR) repeat protein
MIWKAWTTFLQQPPWALEVAAALTILAFCVLQWRFRLSRYGFQAACVLLFLVLLPRLGDDLLDSGHDSKDIAALAGILIVLALGAHSGQRLLARLKKIGPLELFEQKAPELIGLLKEMIEKMDIEMNSVLRTATRVLSTRALYAYRRAHDLIQYVEHSGTVPSTGSELKYYCDLLLKYSQLATGNLDWWAARWALSRIKELNGENFEPFKVAYNLGRAYDGCADSIADEKEGRNFKRQALACYAKAAKLDRFDSNALFFMAYVQDDLEMFDYAIANNRKVLKLRDRGRQAVAAHYNIAISLIKKNEIADAWAELQQIVPRDDQERRFLLQAWDDKELLPLLRDPRYGGRTTRWLNGVTNLTV